ncbi:DUF2834 domain-containing protein [soil metagenome]
MGRNWLATVYFGMAILGAAIPLAQFLPWFAQHGLDLPRFFDDLFVNPISRFFAWDVILSALVLTLFVIVQGRRDQVRHRWLAILATFVAGVSCGLPLFLALRERKGRA